MSFDSPLVHIFAGVALLVFLVFFFRDLYPFALWIFAGRPASPKGPVAKRRGWLSFLLTQICPGAGQLYNRDLRWVAISVALSFGIALGSEIWLFDSLAKLLWAVGIGLVIDTALSVQAYLKSKRIGEQELRPYQRWSVYLLFIFLVYGVPDGYGLLMPSRIRSFQIPSESMVPNLLVGDRLVADGWAYWHSDPKRGDIIVFDYPKDPNTKFVKRLVGLPGDVIEMKKGELYINNQIVPQNRTPTPLIEEGPWRAAEYLEKLGDVEHTIHRAQPENTMDFGPVTVPEGNYFMMGDNRDRSSDSRAWGFVARDALIGRMAYVYFSWDAPAFEAARERDPVDLGAAVKDAIRWERFGRQVR
jgi:signal peptidase I